MLSLSCWRYVRVFSASGCMFSSDKVGVSANVGRLFYALEVVTHRCS